jgi:hypothetical protein
MARPLLVQGVYQGGSEGQVLADGFWGPGDSLEQRDPAAEGDLFLKKTKRNKWRGIISHALL